MKDAHCSTADKKCCPGKPLLKIAVGAVTIWGIGMIWYGDALFGKQWMNLAGITQEAIMETMKTQGGKIMGLSILNCAVVSFALHALFCMANAFCFGKRLAVALIAALGIAGTVIFSGHIWEQKPMELVLIGVGYYAAAFASVAGMSSILGRVCGQGPKGSAPAKDGCCAN